MIDNHIPVHYSNRSRRFVDRLTARVISACGIGVLLVMMLLFVWLLWVVMPLFATPSMQPGLRHPALSTHPAVALGAGATGAGVSTHRAQGAFSRSAAHSLNRRLRWRAGR
ncbi:hypothetical protein HA44_09610 [Mixta gaviniae]|nr:hypothetical protein HA44_09610 [Mixta gaviniae]